MTLLVVIVALLGAAGSFGLGWFLCSRTQANRFEAAAEIAQIVDVAHTRVLESAAAQANLSPKVDALTRAMEGQQESFGRMADALDVLDRGQATILNGMIHAGILQRAEAKTHPRQKGEPPAGDALPPSLELGNDRQR